eukprot:CAMPEP_0170549206 /NCGR_PEP_ID=MMETSP0211-20121228/7402_1 /TAXON_ID=311385 /ORGANISM="Pseudokeronopsis sp., Strain OXSARD2" /LENGTH=94 /DNA_ID=CAMNT_0010855113 /DNA_START=2062 /DNA_END=2346 /DNA_ORIENTATION=+
MIESYKKTLEEQKAIGEERQMRSALRQKYKSIRDQYASNQQILTQALPDPNVGEKLSRNKVGLGNHHYFSRKTIKHKQVGNTNKDLTLPSIKKN